MWWCILDTTLYVSLWKVCSNFLPLNMTTTYRYNIIESNITVYFLTSLV